MATLRERIDGLRAALTGDPEAVELPYVAQPKQQLLHDATARLIVWGGSAGAGKSAGCRWDAIMLAIRNPGLHAALFRRTRHELLETHIRQIQEDLAGLGLGHWNHANSAFEFDNGSVLSMCYCEAESDVFRYHSREMHALYLDEATLLSPTQIAYLRARVRLGGFQPRTDACRLPRMVMATNPGGPSHSLVKAIIDASPAETVFMHEGWPTIFIPARMSDNRYIDADYGEAFRLLPPEVVRAYRDGDWDAIVGAAIHNLSRDRHMVGFFKPPKHWLRFTSMDWGVRRPFAVYWFAVADESYTIKFKFSEGGPKFVPKGAIIIYKELYGGDKNVGVGWHPHKVADRIKEMEVGDTAPMYRVADTELWAQHGGPCNAELFAERGIYWSKAKKDRARNYQEFLTRLCGDGVMTPDGLNSDRPMLFVSSQCLHWWRTVPALLIDPLHPDRGWANDPSAEDHAADATAYGLRSRPWVMDEAAYDELHMRDADDDDYKPVMDYRPPYSAVH